ncbi:hypothetical protein MKW98_005071 [Papaver atlanticum]|uniref:Uncharacterized protein n=1 Tax=Papaver atlanticum TaxID=357466 RepID=A0AAD4XDF3_9MAGN|nr:hypothetical protein MKW98_005071 [Papaver atlanticum]
MSKFKAQIIRYINQKTKLILFSIDSHHLHCSINPRLELIYQKILSIRIFRYFVLNGRCLLMFKLSFFFSIKLHSLRRVLALGW